MTSSLSISRPALRTIHGQVVQSLGLAIVTGDAAAGDTLAAEPVLCEQLGVSRGALREAVKALAAKGMLETRPRTGTRILPRSRWNLLDPDVLDWLGRADRPGLVAHLTELRALVEPGAAALAADRATTAERRELLATCDAMAAAVEAGDAAGVTEHDVRFHAVLLRITHNPMLASLNTSLEVAMRASFEMTSGAEGAIEASVPLHRALAEAVSSGHAVAARAASEALIAASSEHFAAVIR